MSQRKGGQQERDALEAEGRLIELLPSPPAKQDSGPAFMLERAPQPEMGQVRKGVLFANWELDAQHRGKGRALGSKASKGLRDKVLATQLMLGETVAGDIEGPGLLDIIGSDMTMAQRRAIHALYVMLHDRRYQPDDSAEFQAGGGQLLRGLILICSPIEYLEAYGLERAASGHMNRAQREEALGALYYHARQPRYIRWPVWAGSGRKRHKELLVLDGPLVMLTKRYRNMSEQEETSSGEPDNARLTKLMIIMHPLLTLELERYFYLQPRDHYQRLAAAYQQVSGKTLRKLPEALDKLATWLRTLGPNMVKRDEEGLPYYTISREKLAQKILPSAMLEHRRQSRANDAIQQAIAVALELGLLLKWEPAMSGTGFTFWPNPEQCSRLRAAALEPGERPQL